MINSPGEMLSNFWKRPALFKICFFAAWILLGVSKLLISILEFKRVARFLGCHEGIEPHIPIVESRQEQQAKIMGAAIQTAARFTPWNSNCFPQALTATLMLRCFKIPYAMFFGVKKDNKVSGIAAHAWVVSGKARVTGGASFKHYKTVGCFVSKGCETKRIAD